MKKVKDVYHYQIVSMPAYQHKEGKGCVSETVFMPAYQHKEKKDMYRYSLYASTDTKVHNVY